jgi:hypothetical protein
MVAILPASLAAGDAGAAILRGNGGVLLNGGTVPESSVLYSGDTVETQPNAVARIEATGATVDIHSETVLTFENGEIVLEHGRVSVNTSTGFKVRAGCVIVTPQDQEWTQYDVIDIDGKVTVAALKRDVNIDLRSTRRQPPGTAAKSERVTVREGEQKSRDEKCGGTDIKPGDAVAATGAILNSPYAVAIGAGIVVGGTTCVLFCFHQQPASPSCPKETCP